MESKTNKPSGDTIYYGNKASLSWNDFKGKPNYNYFGGAVTASGFAFDADIRATGNIIYLKIGVYTFFSKSNSWKKPEINSDYHLLHEQKHFDITRLGAENFVKQIAKANFTKDNYNKLMTSIFDEAYAGNVAIQKEYDKETRHSINIQKQSVWNDKVSEELKKVL